jgi:hypothetical protein
VEELPPPPPPLNALRDEPDELGLLTLCDDPERLAPLPADDWRVPALGLDCLVLALGDDCLVLALGVCRFPDGPVGLSPEPPEERGVVDPDRFAVAAPDLFGAERSDADKFCAADVRCEAALDRFAPVPDP